MTYTITFQIPEWLNDNSLSLLIGLAIHVYPIIGLIVARRNYRWLKGGMWESPEGPAFSFLVGLFWPFWLTGWFVLVVLRLFWKFVEYCITK